MNLCNFNKTVEWEGRSNSCEFPDEVNFTTTIKPFASFYPPNAYVGSVPIAYLLESGTSVAVLGTWLTRKFCRSATAAGAASEGLNNWDCVRGNPGVWFDNVYPFWQCKQEFVCTPNNAT